MQQLSLFCIRISMILYEKKGQYKIVWPGLLNTYVSARSNYPYFASTLVWFYNK